MTTLSRVSGLWLLLLALCDFGGLSVALGQVTAEKPLDSKSGRQPVEYQPIFLQAWQKAGRKPTFYAWEGEKVVLLTTSPDLDQKTIDVFLKRLDAAWKLCGDITGYSPQPYKQHKGKPTIAAIPEPSLMVNLKVYGNFATNGGEVSTFDGPNGDYERVRKALEQFPTSYFQIPTQNHYGVAQPCLAFNEGAGLVLRRLCIEDAKLNDDDAVTRHSLEQAADAYAKSNLSIGTSFPHLSTSRPMSLIDTAGQPMQTSIGKLLGSIVLKLRDERGGNEWLKKFYRHLSACPATVGLEQQFVQAQLLNFTIAASLASQSEPTKDFQTRWRFPFDATVWAALKMVDWKKPGLTAIDVIDALPSEQLLPSIVQLRPSFLTPERRKQNLLVGGTFEDGSGGTWKVNTWRNNKSAAAIVSDQAKEGRKSVAVRSLGLADDAMYEQAVGVKAGTRYLLSGWIKTKNVVVVEPGGQRGANLSIEGLNGEVSQSLQGTNDWRYVALVFDSRERTEVTVRARLGFHMSTATGEAWFDDLVLIPLGPSPVRPTSSTPIAPSVIVTNKDWKGWSKDGPAPAIAPFNAEQAKQHQEAWAKHLKVPVEYTNSIGMKFVLVPPGEFVRGSTPAEIDEARKHIGNDDRVRNENSLKSEGPQHKVVLTQPFYLGANEVRQQDYLATMGVNPAIFSQNGPQPAFRPNFDTSKMPVENVSWINAADFCARLSVKEQLKPTYSRSGFAITPLVGNGYRLPTEAEWEFACRAGTTTRVWFARDEDVSQFVWLANPAGGRPYPVGQLKPNPFGLYDIFGNVCEWAHDGWSPTAYESFGTKPAVDPVTAFVGTNERVLRGIVWPFTATGMRSSSRFNQPMTNARHFFGFRAALSVDAVKLALANPVQAEALPVVDDAKEALTLKGHTNGATSVAFSPDGKRLVSASSDQTVRVWDAVSGREILILKGHTGTVSSVAFSPDGKRVASASIDQTVKVWDSTSGEELLALRGHTGGLLGVAFSADGKRLASSAGATEKIIKIWDATNGQVTHTLTGHSFAVHSVAFTPDGKQLVSGGDTTVKIWDVASGSELRTLKGHRGHVMGIAISPDGKWLASGCTGAMLKIWDAKSGQEIRSRFGHTQTVKSLAFSPDGKRLASASYDKTIKIWDVASGQELLTLNAHEFVVSGVSFSSDGKQLASAGGDGTVKVWDVTPRHEDDKDRKNTAQDWKGWPKDAPPPAIAPFDAAQAKQHQEAWAKHLKVPVEYTNSIGMELR